MEPEKRLQEKFSSEEIEKIVEDKIRQFQGLLTREVALRLIAKEQGLWKEEARPYALNEISAGAVGVCTAATIARIYPLREYASGKRSRTLILKEGDAQLPLVLWNEDADTAQGLKVSDQITIREAYEKDGRLSLSYKGEFALQESGGFFPLTEVAAAKEPVTVRGVVQEIDPPRTYQRNGARRMQTMRIGDTQHSIRCVAWEDIGRLAEVQTGDEVVLEQAQPKNGELHIGTDTRILVKRKNGIRGILHAMDCEGERLHLRLDGKEIRLERNDALRVLGVEANKDIALATIVKLKKESMLNTHIALPTNG